MAKKKLKIKKMVLTDSMDEDGGLYCMSLVDLPAIEENFIMLSAQTKIELSITDEMKKIVTGPSLVPNKHIYRIDPDTGEEFYMVIDAETIEKTVQKFFKQSKNNNVDLMHDGTLVVGVTLFESYITNKAAGKTYGDLPDGSWIVSYKVDNPVIWEAVKAGVLKGFSIAGLFDLEEVKQSAVVKQKSDRQILREVINILNSVQH